MFDTQIMAYVSCDVKLIFIMRDPVARSWSSVMNSERKKRLTFSPSNSEAALRYSLNEPRFGKTNYLHTIEMLEIVFSRKNIFYGFSDDMKFRPLWFAEQLCDFLEVSPNELSNYVPKEPVGVVSSVRGVPTEYVEKITPHLLSLMIELADKFEGHPRKWLEKYAAFGSSKGFAQSSDLPEALSTGKNRHE